MVSHRPSYRVPNLVIAGRVLLAFAAVGMLAAGSPLVAAGGVAMTIVVLVLDGVDGMVARRMGLASRFGAVLDITADRIVEHVFWIYFAVAHQVGVWVPFVVMTRSFVVDTVRGLALAHGRTAFGDSTMMQTRLTRFLTGSRWMRNLYGGSKTAAFVLLGGLVALERSGGDPLSPQGAAALKVAAGVAVVTTVMLCVIRGVPVVWDSRPYLFGPSTPGEGAAEA